MVVGLFIFQSLSGPLPALSLINQILQIRWRDNLENLSPFSSSTISLTHFVQKLTNRWRWNHCITVLDFRRYFCFLFIKLSHLLASSESSISVLFIWIIFGGHKRSRIACFNLRSQAPLCIFHSLSLSMSLHRGRGLMFLRSYIWNIHFSEFSDANRRIKVIWYECDVKLSTITNTLFLS